MQKYNRINDYFNDFWKSIYDIYSKHAIPYLVTYYNIDTALTVWDNIDLMGGSYEKIGQYSGIKWKKILTLPVYFIGETNTIFDATESGYINEGAFEFVIPSSYGITPYPNDILKLYQSYLQTNDIYEIFAITGVEKQSTGDKTYWKCTSKTEQSRTTTEVDLQVSEDLIFFDYDKKIHAVATAENMIKLLSKNSTIRSNLNGMFDQNSGLYFI